MARVPFSGAPEAQAPEEAANPPEALERISAPPGAFGAAIGQGAQEIGEAGLKIADFYSQVAANHATNNFLDFSNKLLYGDPSNGPAVGPDGQPLAAPDGSATYNGGLFSLRGAKALEARPEVAAQFDEALEAQREGLRTPRARLQFDTESRRYRAQVMQRIGEWSDQQMRVYGKDTNDTSALMAQNTAARAFGNDDVAATQLEVLKNAYAKNADLEGLSRQGAVLRAEQDMAVTRIHAAVGANDGVTAQRLLDANQGLLGSLKDYDQLANQVREADVRATMIPTARAFGDQALATAAGSVRAGFAGGAPGVAPAAEAQLDAPDRSRAAATMQLYQSPTYGGWSPAAAAAIAGSLYNESGISPNPRGSNDGGAAYGAAQWHADRQTDFAGWAGHPMRGSSLAEQQAFVNYELTRGKYKAVGDELRQASTPEQAAAIMMKGYENPKDQSPQALANRQAVARQIAGGTFAPPAPPAASGAQQPTLGASYPSVADALRANSATNEDAAWTEAERLYPNYPEAQAQWVSYATRQLNVRVTQQEEQYKVDTHVVQGALAGDHPPTTEDELKAVSPQVAAAWASVQVNNPYAAIGIGHMLDANAHGKAAGYGAQFSGLLDRALAGADDPGRLKTASDLWTFVGSQPDSPLTNSGANALSDLVAVRGTPQGEAFAGQVKTLFDAAHGQISFANDAQGRADPKGEELYAKFVAAALPALVHSYQTTGSAGKLLDPKAPEYLGNLATTFMRTPAEWLAYRIGARAEGEIAGFGGEQAVEQEAATRGYRYGFNAPGQPPRSHMTPASLLNVVQRLHAAPPAQQLGILQAAFKAGQIDVGAADFLVRRHNLIPTGPPAPPTVAPAPHE